MKRLAGHRDALVSALQNAGVLGDPSQADEAAKENG